MVRAAVQFILEYFIHLDTHLSHMIQAFGGWSYLILTLIVFCESGVVFVPMLPGDSLLFAVGLFAGTGQLSFPVILVCFILAAIAGYFFNYAFGRWSGARLVAAKKFIRQEHLESTHAFFVKRGGKAILIARFLPIIRTFTPFIAGIGRMDLRAFTFYNVLGSIVWIISIVGSGYFFGNIPVVRSHFSHIVLGIVVFSMVPMGVEFIRSRRHPPAPPSPSS